MVDFSNLKQLDISADKTALYTLLPLKGSPKLILSPATADNKPFFNDALKRSRNTQKSKTVNSATVDAIREADRVIFSEYIVKSWEGVTDKSGEPVPFTKENCLDFLKALPNWIFDDLRIFASSIENFVDYDQSEEEEAIKN